MKTSIILQNIQRLRSLLLIASVSGMFALTAGSAFSAQIVGVYSDWSSGRFIQNFEWDINTLGDAPGNPGGTPTVDWGSDQNINDYADNFFGAFTAFNGDSFTEENTLTFLTAANNTEPGNNSITNAYFQVEIDLTGVQDIQADFTMGYEKLKSSDFASSTIDLEYDTGSGFVSFGGGDTTIPGPGGKGETDAVIFSYDLSAITALDDADSVTLRWNIPDITQTTDEGNPNLRFDNLQVYGTVVPEPSATALLLGTAFLFLAFRRRRG